MLANDRILRGKRIELSRFMPDQVSDRYVSWLNDPVVNAYSRRRNLPPTSRDAAQAWLGSLGANDIVLAIRTGAHGHIGNIKFGPVDFDNRRADISIMIGEPAVWGQGYGAEAIYTVAGFLLTEAGLNRVDAGSANPAFLASVRKLGWDVEGIQHERVWLGDRFVDWTLVAQLASRFTRHPEYEPS